MIQHKLELKRPMATEPILRKVIDDENGNSYKLIICKYFREGQNKEICEKLKENYENSFVLYPTEKSVEWRLDDKIDVEDPTPISQDKSRPKTNLIVIDGTWRQAQSIYAKSDFLKSLKTCKITQSRKKKSEYLIRTQPTEASLCTLEAVGLALKYLKEDEDIYESLLKPLRKMCQIQIDHGSEVQQSKQFRIANGFMDEKCLPQNNNRKKNNMKRLIDDYFEGLKV